jgi:hypothetical protein
MLSNDTNSDDGAHDFDHEIACVAMMMLLVEWFVCAQDHFL